MTLEETALAKQRKPTGRSDIVLHGWAVSENPEAVMVHLRQGPLTPSLGFVDGQLLLGRGTTSVRLGADTCGFGTRVVPLRWRWCKFCINTQHTLLDTTSSSPDTGRLQKVRI